MPRVLRGGIINPDYQRFLNQKRELQLAALRAQIQPSAPTVRSTPTAPAQATGAVASASPSVSAAEQAAYNLANQRLKESYENVVLRNVRNLNRRGLFGSSIAGSAQDRANREFLRAQAELAQRQTAGALGLQQQQAATQSTLADIGFRQQQLDLQRQQQQAQQQRNLLSLLQV